MNLKERKIPKYREILNHYKNEISKGVFEEGDNFYSENELLMKHDVSRITIRHALKILEEEGYITKSQGQTSKVLNPNKLVWDLIDITEDFKVFEEDVVSEVISIEKVMPSKKISDALFLKENDFVYRIERIRKIKERHITRSISHLVPWLKGDLTKINFTNKTSITKILKEMGEISSYASETFEAINADAITAKLLHINDNEALFYRERITYNQNNIPIEFVESYYNSRYVKYHIKNKIFD